MVYFESSLKNFEKEIDIIKNSSNLNNGGATRLTLGNVIVNETINLGLTKGHAKLLVKEGTKLPVKDIKLENLVIPVGTKEYDIDKKLFKRMVEDIKVLIEEEFDDKFKLKLLNGFSKMIDVK